MSILKINQIQHNTAGSAIIVSGSGSTTGIQSSGTATNADDLTNKTYVDSVAVDNTASNVGTSGEGIFFQKTGADLEFKGVDVSGTYLTVATNGVNKTIQITGNPIVNADIDGAAAILSSKLDLTTVTQSIGGTGFLSTSSGAGDAYRVPRLNSAGKIDASMIPTAYLNQTDSDARYYQQTVFVGSTTGVAEAGRPVKLNASGRIDQSMIVDSDIDHTLITNIGTNTHAQIDTHIANTSNPHSVTAAQVGNTTAQWNADKLQGTNISSSSPVTGDSLRYDGTNWSPYTRHNAAMYFSANATATTIGAVNTPVKISATYSSEELVSFTHLTGRLTYNGTSARKFRLQCSLSFLVATNDRRAGAYIAINGAVVTRSNQRSSGSGAADGGFVNLILVTTLNQNDYVEIFVENNETADSITVTNLYTLITEL